MGGKFNSIFTSLLKVYWVRFDEVEGALREPRAAAVRLRLPAACAGRLTAGAGRLFAGWGRRT